MGTCRTVVAYRNCFEAFMDEQTPKAQAKILQILRLVEELEIVPQNYLKHIEGTNGLYEIRIGYGRQAFRVLCCFDEGKLVILLSAFVKKTQKTPLGEINKALALKKSYFEEKTANL